MPDLPHLSTLTPMQARGCMAFAVALASTERILRAHPNGAVDMSYDRIV
jgi:DNA-binding sugar fermentation-stimulating protein